MRSTLIAATAASVLASATAVPAYAGAFYLQEQSVRGAGRAFSGEVADTGASSLWWNPAASGGMTGVDAYAGLSAVLPRSDVEDEGTPIVRPGQAPAPVGGEPSARNPINDGYIPSGAIAVGLSPKLSLGLAVTFPYSFTTNYRSQSWVRYTADKTRLRTLDLQPSIAFAPSAAVSLGAALNVERVSASLSNFLPNLSPLLPDGHQTLAGNGWDVGFTVGGQVRADRLVLGASFKSSVRHRLNGSVTTDGLLGPLASQNMTVPTHATFRTPWQIDLGARFKVSELLTLDAQVNRIGWSRFDAIRLGAPLDVAIPETYRNTWSYGAGVDYAVTPAWTLRGGIQHDQTPTRDGFRDARVPDGNRWTYALGTSLAVTNGLTLDAAADYLSVADASVDRLTAAYAGTPVQTPIVTDGRLVHGHVAVVSLGARLRL